MKKVFSLVLTLLCMALVVPMQISAASVEFTTFNAPGTVRIDASTGAFNGYVGIQITIGSADVEVTALGRLFVNGNTQAHDAVIVNSASLKGVAKVTIPAGGENNKFTYADLSSPVTLKAGKTYYVACHESIGGDGWYHSDSVLKFASVATCDKCCYKDDAETAWGAEGAPNTCYGPVSFKYTTATASAATDSKAESKPAESTPTVTESSAVPSSSAPTSSAPASSSSAAPAAEEGGSLVWLWIVIAVFVIAAVVAAVVVIKRKNI